MNSDSGIMVIVTEKFKPSPGLYAGILLRRWLTNNLWWLILPVTLFLALGALVNGSFFYVTVIYILCVASLSQAIIFFNYALRPDTVIKTFEQQWEFRSDSAIVTYFPTVTINDETVNPLVDSTSVPAAKITRVNITGQNLILTLHNDYNIYIIPLSKFADRNHLSEIFKFYEPTV